MAKRIVAGVTMAFILLTTGACKREATGQVAAVADGEDITMQEINAEIGPNVPADADKKAVQAAALNNLIDRRMLAKAAKDDGLNETSEYLVRTRQLNDALLVQLLSDKTAQSIKVPGDAEIARYIAAHPAKFADRKIYAVDRIQFAKPSDASWLSKLEPLHSMQAVADMLSASGVRFVRKPDEIDTATVPKVTLDSIIALPAGEPFVTGDPQAINVSAVTGSRPAPITGPDASPIAVRELRMEALQKVMQDRLKAVRGAAEISYQPGFAPPAAKALQSASAR